MQLNRYTEKELELIIEGIILQYDYIEPIDNEYDLKIRAYILKNNMINITANWLYGNHEIYDDRYSFAREEIKINADSNLRKLIKEVNNIIEIVISKPYNPEMDNDEFKDEY